jgi:choline dehydrogenase-like flavoprotein
MTLLTSLLDPCGTARLGQNIEQGAVDSKLKVFGIDNLRVIDASVIPVIPDCRIQNSVYMIAEKVRYQPNQLPKTQITNNTSTRALT